MSLQPWRVSGLDPASAFISRRTSAVAASMAAMPSGSGTWAKLSATDALEQLGVDQRGHRLAVLLDEHAVVTVLHDVEHLAQVLAKADGAGFSDHHKPP
jgi:hypothetical protein